MLLVRVGVVQSCNIFTSGQTYTGSHSSRNQLFMTVYGSNVSKLSCQSWASFSDSFLADLSFQSVFFNHRVRNLEGYRAHNASTLCSTNGTLEVPIGVSLYSLSSISCKNINAPSGEKVAIRHETSLMHVSNGFLCNWISCFILVKTSSVQFT